MLCSSWRFSRFAIVSRDTRCAVFGGGARHSCWTCRLGRAVGAALSAGGAAGALCAAAGGCAGGAGAGCGALDGAGGVAVWSLGGIVEEGVVAGPAPTPAGR